MISGNKVKIKVDIATYKCHQFKNFIYWMLNQWLGVLWHLPLVGENFGDSTRLVNIDTFGTDRENK